MATAVHGSFKRKDDAFEKMSDLVDNFVNDDFPKQDPGCFWENLFENIEVQQQYAQCLIYKYICFTYGLGREPLREAICMIKNITTHPNPSTALTLDSIKTKETKKHISVDSSPYHKRLGTPGNSGRRGTTGEIILAGGKRESLAPSDLGGNLHGKVKRKSSGNLLEESYSVMQSKNPDHDGNTSAKLRELIYTISYLINSCDLQQWEFNSLREVYLVWTKARSWEQAASAFEQAIMKKFAKPPEGFYTAEEKWERSLQDILCSFHNDGGHNAQMFTTLDHTMAGNSIKYATFRNQVENDEHSIHHIIEAVTALIEKNYGRNGGLEILSLLHILSEAVVMAPYVPMNSLQHAYENIQKLLLMPLPVSSVVKEVLDLIQAEMKSPGYFRRTIFFQELEMQNLNQNTNAAALSGTPVNIFVDKGKGNWDTMETALGHLVRKCDCALSSESEQQRLLVEHIFHSVFGPSSCDIPNLRQTLETCSESQLTHIYTEALNVMEQSASMEDPISAQQFVRQQLEALSITLAADEQDGKSSNENLPVIQEVQQQSDEAASSKPKPSSSQSSPALLTLVQPPRNSSYLSRTASTVSSTSSKSSLSAIGERKPKKIFAIDKMNYIQIAMKSFDKNQLADAIFELVRLTAKEFVAEKRKSSSYSSAQKRYLDKKRSTLLSSGNARDSGLIEDYADGDKNSPGKASLKSQEKSPVASADKSSVASENASPKTSDERQSGDFWEKFSKKGFVTPKFKENGESLEALVNSFRFSGLVSDDEKKEQENMKRNSGNLHSPVDVKLRRSKSSVSDRQSLKPPIEPKDTTPDTLTQEKPNSSRSKKAKRRFLTIGRKGMKIVRGIRRSPSQRGADFGSSVDLSTEEEKDFRSILEDNSPTEETDMSTRSETACSTPVDNSDFFDEDGYSRWRTTSLPIKNSLRKKRKDKTKRMNILQLFPSTGDISLQGQANEMNEVSKMTKSSTRRHSTSPKDSVSAYSVSKSFSFDALDKDRLDPLNEVEAISRSQSNNALLCSRKLSIDDKQQVFVDDDESRSRMDSGITADKSSDDTILGSSGGYRGDYWEDTGVAGVKFPRRQGLRRNQTNRYSLSQQIHGRLSKKKVLKLAFVGNDRTVGDMARAYYELRRRQLTRAPLLHHIDLRLYYIPIGENAFADEYGSKKSGCGPFDLEISEMLGAVDPWYRSVVTMSANNLVRVCPSINNEDVEDKLSEAPEKKSYNFLPTSDNLLANSILSYFRFAIKTCYVPIFKAVMRTSADDVITEVFCCRAEIGHIAYRQAIAAGRFGKLGKLVDLSNDTGPPPAYTQLKYKKCGINGNFIASKPVEETNYYRVCFIPIALSGSHQDQARFAGADGLQLTSIDNDKRLKLMKRGTKFAVADEDLPQSKFTVSEAKIEVVRPVQGTFTVCLDHTLIHTNIKSFEISRCLAPEYEGLNSRKRKQTTSVARVMSLPLKTFQPHFNLH